MVFIFYVFFSAFLSLFFLLIFLFLVILNTEHAMNKRIRHAQKYIMNEMNGNLFFILKMKNIKEQKKYSSENQPTHDVNFFFSFSVNF